MAIPGDIFIETNGGVQGTIIPEERGAGGFGYDPIFFIPKINKTFAQLSPEEKDLLSHRARAIKRAKRIIERYI